MRHTSEGVWRSYLWEKSLLKRCAQAVLMPAYAQAIIKQMEKNDFIANNTLCFVLIANVSKKVENGAFALCFCPKCAVMARLFHLKTDIIARFYGMQRKKTTPTTFLNHEFIKEVTNHACLFF